MSLRYRRRQLLSESRDRVWRYWCEPQNEFYERSPSGVSSSCYECGRVVNRNARPGSPYYWHKGHMLPKSMGGSSSVSNLRITCTSCNLGNYKDTHVFYRVTKKGLKNSMAYADSLLLKEEMLRLF